MRAAAWGLGSQLRLAHHKYTQTGKGNSNINADCKSNYYDCLSLLSVLLFLTDALFPLIVFFLSYYSVIPMYLPKASLTLPYSERVEQQVFFLSSLLSISSKILQVAQKYQFLSDKMIHPLL